MNTDTLRKTDTRNATYKDKRDKKPSNSYESFRTRVRAWLTPKELLYSRCDLTVAYQMSSALTRFNKTLRTLYQQLVNVFKSAFTAN